MNICVLVVKGKDKSYVPALNGMTMKPHAPDAEELESC